jgi:hypothetical protein
MFRHQVPLEEFPADVVELTCDGCARRGRYRKAALVERFGSQAGLVDVLRFLSQDCPQFPPDFQNITRCKSRYANLLGAQGESPRRR